ncbi:MAG: PQQ-binding-like beta-propeller repeat protein [Phycisphaerales bacterium]
MTVTATARCFGLTAVLLAAMAGGCSSGSGNMFAKSEVPPPPLKGSEAIDRDAYTKLGYGLAWSGFAAFNESAHGKPDKAAVLGDMLVIADDTTATTALSATSGAFKWALQVDNRAGRFWGLARMHGAILTCNETEFFAINAETGQLIDRQRPKNLPTTGSVVMGDLVTFGAGDRVVAYEMGIRGTAWAYRFPGTLTTEPVTTGGTTVCFTSNDGTVGILDCTNGTMVGAGHMYAGAGATPGVGDGAVFVPGLDQSLWAFNTADGSRRWQVRTEVPLVSSPAVYKGHVMLHVPGTGLVSVDSKTGSQQWVAQGVAGAAVAVRKGNMIFFDKATGDTTVIDPSNGDIVTKVTLPNVAMLVTGETNVDGDLYAISPRGEVSKFVPR